MKFKITVDTSQRDTIFQKETTAEDIKKWIESGTLDYYTEIISVEKINDERE